MAIRKPKNKFFWTRLRRRLILAAGGVLLSSVAITLLFRWVPVPTTAFMLRQWFSGTSVDYRWVPMDRISPNAALAVIASEDQNFFSHWGIDFNAVADAIEENRTRKHPRGASTISQQVAKNLFLWSGASYVRKGLEVYFTLMMEMLWPKQRILTVYLNIAEMGTGVFGVEAASQRFYGRPASRLSRQQAATLAAVLPAPRRMSAVHPSHYVVRRTWQIMDQMNRLGGTAFLRRHAD